MPTTGLLRMRFGDSGAAVGSALGKVGLSHLDGALRNDERDDEKGLAAAPHVQRDQKGDVAVEPPRPDRHELRECERVRSVTARYVRRRRGVLFRS